MTDIHLRRDEVQLVRLARQTGRADSIMDYVREQADALSLAHNDTPCSACRFGHACAMLAGLAAALAAAERAGAVKIVTERTVTREESE